MKIYIKSSNEMQAYLAIVSKALSDAGHVVRNQNNTRNDQTGKERCDICLELTAGGLHQCHTEVKQSSETVSCKADVRIQKLVLVIGNAALPRRAIVDALQLRQKSRAIFTYNYLKPAISKGYVTMTHPAHPNLPEQSYRLTANGLNLYKELTEVQE
ncbi:MAG: hypothetical protein J5902_07960 [Paludibacteraceae bacterium]|nr:hypothetical protein [Paludibacteraceae bacterium]